MAKIVTMGEMIMRLAPQGYERFTTTKNYEAYYGGVEANVAANVSQFGHDAYYVTTLPDNDLGQAGINSLRKYGVKTDYILRSGEKMAIYFAETGVSMRPSKVIYDRAGTDFSKSKFEDYDFNAIFENCDLVHISGITPSLSEEAQELLLKTCEEAQNRNVLVSYDFNFRSNLWSWEDCKDFSDKLFPFVDILIGYIPDGVDWKTGSIDHNKIEESFKDFYNKYNLKLIVSTLRNSISASDNELYAVMYDGKEYMISSQYDVRIVNRFGGGDAFASGIISEYLYGNDSKNMLEFAIASSAWKHTIYDDNNIATREEINKISSGDISGKVQR